MATCKQSDAHDVPISRILEDPEFQHQLQSCLPRNLDIGEVLGEV